MKIFIQLKNRLHVEFYKLSLGRISGFDALTREKSSVIYVWNHSVNKLHYKNVSDGSFH